MEWVWEQIDESRSGSSGDVSKLFKNEELKRPGIFSLHPPRPDATVMAREVIQNAWDAAQDLRQQLREEPDFDIEFEFRNAPDTRKARLTDLLDLDGLALRASRQDWRKLGLPEDSFLADHRERPLRTLEIREHGTSGMYGPWSGAKSKMYLALVSIGFTEKPLGAGGSYGYGKAGLIRGSATRTLVAYTCFREREDDPGVTRRLLGMTYWGPHQEDGANFNGFARLGNEQHDATVRPFENGEADEVAARLGLAVRSPDRNEDLGTTFLVIDPTVHPNELVRAIERNWWPVLESESTLGVEVIDYDDTTQVPRPTQSQELQAFIRAYEIANQADNETASTEKRVQFLPSQEEPDLELGSLGLVGNPPGWSYPSGEDGIDHRSLVALVRSPRMVVEYFEAGYAKPFVRGTFVAHDDVDDLLRQSEPRGHDAWQTSTGDDSTDPRAPVIADAILRRIRQNVNRFRADLKPPVPNRREIRLPELERLFRLVVEDEGPEHQPPPKPPPRKVGISILEQEPEIAPQDPTMIRLHARVAYRLTEHYSNGDQADVRLQVRYKFVEDDRAGQACPLELDPPTGFSLTGDGILEGPLGREPVEVVVTSDPYPPDWTGELTVEAGVLTGESDE